MKPSAFVLILVIALPTLAGADGSPGTPSAHVRMMTEWGEGVTSANAWREYPRPQFVRAQWLNLNGSWDYAIRPKTAPRPADGDFDGSILVPFAVESPLSGVERSLLPDDRLHYRRRFVVPPDWHGQRVLLHFGAVDFECTVFVNDALVGSHTGGSDAFSFDLTDYLQPGDNALALVVADSTDRGEQPRGKQQLEPRGIWYTPVSGIWQTVWLEPVPPVHIAELRLTPDIDAGVINVAVLLNDAVKDDTWAVRLTVLAGEQPVACTLMRADRATALLLPEPRLWSPADPYLYSLTAELVRVENPQKGRGGANRPPKLRHFGAEERAAYAAARVLAGPSDTVRSYFGMRKSAIGPGPVAGQPALLLNNRFVFQHGPLDQGWWPDGLLTPPSDAAMVRELQYLKRCGFNMLRKHIKIEPARYYYHCDRLGLLVWQDMPSGFRGGLESGRTDEGEPLRRAASREQFELELRRMLGQLHNHPSIVQWVLFNEGWGQYETAALAAWVKAIDPSRILNAVSGWLDREVGEVRDLHTYGPTPDPPPPDAHRAVVIGEYGGVGWPVAGHLWNPAQRNWGYQTYRTAEDYAVALQHKIEALSPMLRNPGLSAAVYTQTTDVEGEINGLLTYDRRVAKISPATLAALNQTLGVK